MIRLRSFDSRHLSGVATNFPPERSLYGSTGVNPLPAFESSHTGLSLYSTFWFWPGITLGEIPGIMPDKKLQSKPSSVDPSEPIFASSSDCEPGILRG